MPFAYYRRLTPAQKAIYRRSAAIRGLRLNRAAELVPLTQDVQRALEAEDQKALRRASQRLVSEICAHCKVRAPEVKVLARRPSHDWGELHGLYELDPGERAELTVWMRTAKREQVVAFRTYLRTLLHELLHHLDFTFLKLPESFHTEGFYQRESSLFRQLTGGPAERPGAKGPKRRRASRSEAG